MGIAAEPAPPPRLGGTLQPAISQPVTTLDPANYLNFAELQVASNLYEGLVKRDRFGWIISAVAQSWKHSDDHRIWTFTIAHAPKFHNVNPVTASDVKQGWERSIQNSNWIIPVLPLFQIEGVETYRNSVTKRIQGIHVLDNFHLQIIL